MVVLVEQAVLEVLVEQVALEPRFVLVKLVVAEMEEQEVKEVMVAMEVVEPMEFQALFISIAVLLRLLQLLTST